MMINRFVFSQQNLDSGSLTVLASVAHKFSESGQYYGEIFRETQTVGKFSIIVDDDATSSPTVSAGTIQPSIKIDLKNLDQPVSQQLKSQVCNCFKLRPEGYALFFVSTGAGGYRVEIKKPGSERGGSKVFNSAELKEEDMFVATLLRPGTYRITNVPTKANAELVVTYPEIGKTPRHSEPAQIECTEKSIKPDKIRINPAQAIVLRFKTPSRIKIELTKPEDKPAAAEAKKTAVAQSQKRATAQLQKKKPIRRLRINP